MNTYYINKSVNCEYNMMMENVAWITNIKHN